MERRLAQQLAQGLVKAGRVVATALPRGVTQRLDNRIFRAVYQLTRVTNDAYGWRPPDAVSEQEPP